MEEIAMFEKIKGAVLYGKDFLHHTAENFRETAITAVDCAKLHYRIVSNRNELKNLYAILGRTLLIGTGDGGEHEAEINKLCERIKAKEDVLSGLLKQYRVVAGKVICPECGKFMSDSYAYCPYCGKHVSDVSEDDGSDISEEELDAVREIDEL